MAHIQQQILDQVKTALMAAAIVPSGHVHLERVDPLPAGKLPALHVEEADSGERAQDATIKALDERVLDVDVHCHVTDNATYAADARDLGLKAEKAIAADPLLNGGRNAIAKKARCVGSRLLRSGEGERAQAERQQRWQFTYYCDRKTPDVAV